MLALFTASGFAGLIYESIRCRKVYRRYAEMFFDKEQIDDVDESKISGYRP